MSKYTTNGKKSLRKTMSRFISFLASHVLRARETLALLSSSVMNVISPELRPLIFR